MPSNAKEVADGLAYEFLRNGQYSAASGPVELPVLEAAAIADDGEARAYAIHVAEFSGLAVQAVGYEEGSEEPKVHVYLTRGSVRQMRALPDRVDDVPILLHRMGPITVRPDTVAASTNRGNIFERNGRICCGSSCGPTSERSAGTFGAIVRLEVENQLYLLSNNHVLGGCNHVPRNQPILAPANMDGRPDVTAPHEIGRHDQIRILHSGDPYFVAPCDADLALARASNPNGISSWQGDDRDGFDTPTRLREPVSSEHVKKIGRTTGLTFGEVEAKVSTPMPVTYTASHFKGVVWFSNVWTIRVRGSQHFALPGDSGSLVVTADGDAAVGLLFAANRSG
jgi:hypothetical protein